MTQFYPDWYIFAVYRVGKVAVWLHGLLDKIKSKKETVIEFHKNSAPACINKVFLKHYGHIEVSRIREMDRQRILPIERKDGVGDYYVGRLGENGKIQDREPSY